MLLTFLLLHVQLNTLIRRNQRANVMGEQKIVANEMDGEYGKIEFERLNAKMVQLYVGTSTRYNSAKH